MSYTERIPGMKPGSTVRNIAIGGLYVLLLVGMFGAAEEPEESDSDTEASDQANDLEATANESTSESDNSASASASDANSDNELPEHLMLAFEQTMEQENIDVLDAGMDRNEFVVEYTTRSPTERELAGDMGGLSGAYAVIVDEGYGGDRMVVDLYGADDTYIGYYYVESEWALAWLNGEMSDADILDRIIGTIELENGAST